MIILPAVDLIGGKVVRLEQGRFDAVTTYATNPAQALGQFVEAGAEWAHVVDLDGARAGTPVQADLICELARTVLSVNGYRVLEARDGEDALRVAEQHPGPIHLLMTDVVMPRMGGRRLAERMTQKQPGLNVLFLSGYTDDAVVRHGVREAEVAFLQKPFTPCALALKVRDVLDRAD